MRVASLLSGGKDSVYGAALASLGSLAPSVALINRPSTDHPLVYHRPNVEIAPEIARLLGMEVAEFEGEGVNDLVGVLRRWGIDALVAGVVASEFQFWFLQEACEGANCTLYAPLWGRDQIGLLNEYCDAGIDAIITRIAAEGLDPGILGKRVCEVRGKIVDAWRKYGVSPVGEGGEFETLVLGAPWMRGRIEVLRSEVLREGPNTMTLIVREYEVVK